MLETNAGLYFFSVNGGSGSGVAIAGTVKLNSVANFQIGNAPVTFSNVISGAGGFYLNQYGGYPLVFAAANTYQGITDIRSGMVLALIGNGSISRSTPISLASGATLAVTNRTDGTLTLANGQTLQGSGTVQGNLAAAAGSTVAPGTSAATGTLNVSGNATLNGNTVMKLNGASNDVLSVRRHAGLWRDIDADQHLGAIGCRQQFHVIQRHQLQRLVRRHFARHSRGRSGVEHE